MIEQFEIGRWYHDGKRAFEVLAIDIEAGRLVVRYQDEEQPVRRTIVTQSRVAEPRDGPPEPLKPPTPKRKPTRPADDKDSTFTLRETAPIITELIRKRSAETGDFVGRAELVGLILSDTRGRALVERAIALGHTDPPERIAGNMIDHLSKSITEGDSEYTGQFEREKIDGLWAYKAR